MKTKLVSLIACTWLVSAQVHAKSPQKLDFEKMEIDVGAPITHKVNVAELNGVVGKELVVMTTNEAQERIIQIYSLETNGSSKLGEVLLPKSIHSFDITNITHGGKHYIYLLSHDSVFNLEVNERGVALVKVADAPSLFQSKDNSYLQKREFIAELDNNRIAIVLPDFKQTNLLTSSNFTDFTMQPIPIESNINLGARSVTFSPAKLNFSDVNFDGRIDLVEQQDGQLAYYLQNESGQFSTKAQYQKINELIFSTDWWDKKGPDGDSLDQSNLVYRKIEKLQDINNDGLMDLLVRYTTSSGALDRTNDYEIYLGGKQNGLLGFNSEASSVVSADGTLTDLRLVDINNDSRSEVVVSGFDIGVSQIISALLSGTVEQEVHIFNMNDNDEFDKKRKVTKEVELSFSISSGRSGSPIVKLADLNGDGLNDLVLSDDDDAIKVYWGRSGKKMFERRGKKYDITIPMQGNDVVIDDLNSDNKQDLILKYGRLDDDALASKLVLLRTK